MIEVRYGPFPTPTLPVLDLYDKGQVLKQLRLERGQKSGSFEPQMLTK
jgi:hypothetical protein